MRGANAFGQVLWILIPAMIISAPWTRGGTLIAGAIAAYVLLKFCNSLGSKPSDEKRKNANHRGK